MRNHLGRFTTVWSTAAVTISLSICTALEIGSYNSSVRFTNAPFAIGGLILMVFAVVAVGILFTLLEWALWERKLSRRSTLLVWAAIAIATVLFLPMVSLLSLANTVTTLFNPHYNRRAATIGLWCLLSMAGVFAYWKLQILG